GRLAGHAETPFRQQGGDVFARLPGDGQLDVVDGRGAVQDDGAEQPALDPVDEVGGAAGLDDVAAEGGDDGPAVAVGPAQVVAHGGEVLAGQLVRQGLEPVGDTGPGGQRPAEVLDKHLARPGQQVIRPQPVQVEGDVRRAPALAGNIAHAALPGRLV